jgi:hypothetical protein
MLVQNHPMSWWQYQAYTSAHRSHLLYSLPYPMSNPRVPGDQSQVPLLLQQHLHMRNLNRENGLLEVPIFCVGTWGEGCNRKPSQVLLLGQFSHSFQDQRLLPKGKASSLPQRPAMASRAIYFSVPKPLSRLFTQGGQEAGFHVPAQILPPPAWALQAEPRTPSTSSTRGQGTTLGPGIIGPGC